MPGPPHADTPGIASPLSSGGIRAREPPPGWAAGFFILRLFSITHPEPPPTQHLAPPTALGANEVLLLLSVWVFFFLVGGGGGLLCKLTYFGVFSVLWGFFSHPDHFLRCSWTRMRKAVPLVVDIYLK